MILRITIENLFSFKSETEISFIAGKSDRHSEQVFRAEKRDDISILKAGIIYGANASGKSNIIKAVSIIQKIALGSVPGKDIEPFKLVEDNSKPSKVEVEFKVGTRYFAYGVEFNKRNIIEEWLYEINSRTDKEIFSRQTTISGNEFTFGNIERNDEDRQLIKFIGQSTPISDSFLSEYVKRNGKGLECVNIAYTWMKESLKIIFPDSRYNGISIRIEQDKEFAQATKSLLEYFNTGIVDIVRTKISKESLDLPKKLVDDLMVNSEPNKSFLISSPTTTYFFETNADGITAVYKQNAIHRNSNGNNILFDMKEESDGSLRLLDFIPMLIDLGLNESVYLIDEIDRSMHPMLSQKILEYYFSELSNSRGSQLIFSTHESNLLNLELIRADEVWFVEKDLEGASHLYSLAEFKPREDIRRGYLLGRYGAIPFFAPTKDLKWKL